MGKIEIAGVNLCHDALIVVRAVNVLCGTPKSIAKSCSIPSAFPRIRNINAMYNPAKDPAIIKRWTVVNIAQFAALVNSDATILLLHSVEVKDRNLEIKFKASALREETDREDDIAGKCTVWPSKGSITISCLKSFASLDQVAACFRTWFQHYGQQHYGV